MRKNWVALLSVLGLTGSVVRMESQVIKGSTPPATNETVKPVSPAQKTANSGKLAVNQQTLRQQKQGSGIGGKQADPLTPSAYCKGNQGAVNNQLTKGNQQITKSSNNQITKGNQQLTKGNQQLRNATDKSAGQLTKGNQQITKGSNNQITKGNKTALTKAAPPK